MRKIYTKKSEDLNKDSLLESLTSDYHYYGEIGQKFLSYSDLSRLLVDPKHFLEPHEDTLPFIMGRYLHACLLDPVSCSSFPIIDASTRTTKIYKDQSDGNLCLLKKEVDEIEKWVSALSENAYFKEIHKFKMIASEKPIIDFINDYAFKAKCDIETEDSIIDLKTTSDLMRFKYNAYKYNYDLQAYIYKTLFKKDMDFLVIDKNTLLVGFFECSEEFYESGKNKFITSMSFYERFYKEDANESLNDFIFEDVL